MDLTHRIGMNIEDEKYITRLQNMKGIELSLNPTVGGRYVLVVVSIDESNPNWQEVVDIAKIHKEFESYGMGDFFETYFTDAEIRKAAWSRLIPTFEQGYSQPEAEFPIVQSSYELFCNHCVQHRQIDSMRFKKEPHMGRKSFMTQIANGEIHCTPNVFEKLAQIHATGYKPWNCVIHKTGVPLEKVKQLYVTEEAKPGMIPYEGLTKIICPVCGRPKYYSHKKGVMQIKKKAIISNVDFQRTAEWFGSGYIAFQEILVSNRIANLILDEGWQGVRLKVVELV